MKRRNPYPVGSRMQSHQHPFGMLMKERVFESGDYRYSFNGKESDVETETHDYGKRIYNSKLGKFLSVDPIAKDYPWYSPFHFAGNTPIWAIDLDGLEQWTMTSEMVTDALWKGWDNTSGYPIPTNPYDQNANREWVENVSIDLTKTTLVAAVTVLPVADLAEVGIYEAAAAYKASQIAKAGGLEVKIIEQEAIIAKEANTVKITSSNVEAATTTKGKINGKNPFSPSNNEITNDLRTGNPNIDAEAKGTYHTQVGTKVSKTDGEIYPVRRTLNENGKVNSEYHFSEHHRPQNHVNPHVHISDPKTGKWGSGTPVDPITGEPLN